MSSRIEHIIPWKQNIINPVFQQSMLAADQLDKELLPTLLDTHKLSQGQDNLSVFLSNIVLYCKLASLDQLDAQSNQALRDMLKAQLNQIWFEEGLNKFSQEFKLQVQNQPQLQPFQKKLIELQQIIRAVSQQKNNASTQSKYIGHETQVNKYIQHLEDILDQPDIKTAIQNYQLYQNSQKQQHDQSGNSEVGIPSTHSLKELVKTNIHYGPQVFSYIRPQNHQYYISEAAKSYHDVVPFKIKNIALSITDGPLINRPNFFNQDVDQSQAILHYCLPGTNKVAFYSLADVCKVHTIGREYYQERQLSNDWHFSPFTRSTITPSGKIYAVNCRTTKDKIDPYLYQITDSKASNRGPLPAPKRSNALLFLNNCLYLIGGQGEGEKCSRKNYKYDLKTKKWATISQSNVALRKPTVCVVANRYICKLGGLNEFDYINKVIEMYDSLTDKWSMVRASPRNILEEIQILEDSHACQISDDEIYIFGGKNANKFNTDTGFILMISEIREKKKGAAKVTGQFWNVSIGKRNILTAFGQFYSSGVVIQHNCIYGLRVEVGQALAP